MRLGILVVVWVLSVVTMPAQAPDAAKRNFESRCARCHGAGGEGGELGPSLVSRVSVYTDQELGDVIRDGRPMAGMPGFALPAAEAAELIAYLRSLRPGGAAAAPRLKLTLTDGRTLEGTVLSQGVDDLQLLTADKHLHLLRKTAANRYREVTSQANWPTYHGNVNGNRFSGLIEINRTNVSRLAPRWTFSLPNTAPLQTTPVVVNGVMYVTSANECYALDAGTGREIWHYRRPRTKGLVGNAAGGINRGVAVAGDRVFMVTDHAHLIALHRSTGAPLWETEMADWKQNYNATVAPLVVGNLVVSGTSGGDEGVRGFLAAYDQVTGKEAWRFWTVPKPGEPGGETWAGGHEHGCATTWLTGAYDPQTDTLYWSTGNPCPDMNGDGRAGDNLYSDSDLALDAKTGKLKWYFQYTPHDVWDYDAKQPIVLVNANWQGQPRKLLLHANRNGFFYVLDRTDGKFLLGKQFIKKVTWATGLDPNGRPIRNPAAEPGEQPTTVCPAIDGATNWYSTAFSPITGLYYVQSNDRCGVYTKSAQNWEAGKGYMGGTYGLFVPGEPGKRVLRAIEIQTGKIVWELPQAGGSDSIGGVLATAGGLVFFGDDSRDFTAADAQTGKALWRFPANSHWKASPMTYLFDNRQYVAVAAGSSILAFALVP